ncbi:MAG: N-acetylglucosamine-6-phosphate deacetylase [Anaerolineae bacterium]|nr:N-acetylglucosamine-6-phosphate deacetylase [Anaerolineae bacterium]
MSRLILHDATLYTPAGPLEGAWMLMSRGQIEQIGQGAPPRLRNVQRLDGRGADGWCVLPGFIDVHVHGALGYDTMDATPAALETMARFFASRGVTGFLATTMTAPGDAITAALHNVRACLGNVGPATGGAHLLGAHLEGPYLNANAAGAQDPQHIRRADPGEFGAWLGLNVIRVATVAPEFPENQIFIAECRARGVVASVGHTQASYEQTLAAAALGARQMTHTFNAMTGLHHRKPGAAGAALTDDALVCEVIADNIHLHPAILNLIVRAKGPERVVLITDAISGAGMPDGAYELGGQPVTVAGGMAALADGTLAGSILTLDLALRNTRDATGKPLSDLWRLTSANAARQIGLGGRKGTLAPGFDADVTLLDNGLTVRATVVGGQLVYQAS